jgi:ribosomal-protein-serine acetyltransferase
MFARDAGELFMLVDAHRGDLSRWLPWVAGMKAVADASYYIMSLNGFWENGLSYGIFENGELAGTVGFQNGEERHDRVEIGYWLAPPFRGRGMAYRSVKLALKAGFSYSTVHRVEARVQPANTRSIALLTRFGFILEGVEREGMKFPDGRRDHRVYSLLKPEFDG